MLILKLIFFKKYYVNIFLNKNHFKNNLTILLNTLMFGTVVEKCFKKILIFFYFLFYFKLICF